MSKRKFTKQKQNTHDVEDNRKFLLIVAISTIALMVLMYFIFK
jgi:hypothetical protein